MKITLTRSLFGVKKLSWEE